jgi:two-component system cell cycle sensor histidine kinase/response regulator CckA
MKNYEKIIRKLQDQGILDPDKNIRKHLLDELHTHQVELETQNRRLIETRRQLEESLDNYADLYDFAPIGYVTFDDAGIIQSINLAGAAMIGMERARLIGMPFCDYVVKDECRKFTAHLLTCRYESGLVSNEVRLAAVDGVERVVQLLCAASQNQVNGTISYRTAMIDISERKKAEHALIESEKKYRNLFEESRDGIFILSADGRLVDVNPAGLELFGYAKDEMLRLDLDRDMHCNPEDRARFREMLLDAENLQDVEMELRRRDGEKLTVHLSATLKLDDIGTVTGFRVFVHDLTRYKKLEQQLFQAQKMESIGLLAGGVAHDFNNLLTAILGYGETIQENINASDELLQICSDKIREAALRAKELTGKLLAFSRKQVLNPQPVAVNGIIADMTALLGRVMGEDIELRSELSNSGMVVMADAVQIGQVLANLATNARDAMPRGGKLIIETAPVIVDETTKKTSDLEQTGRYARITVSDTGAGIGEDQMKRIFEPFFTTKEIGRGTGLGLAISYGIMKQHGGSIVARNVPGRGATFDLYLPLTEAVATGRKAPEGLSATAGTETILVAEDEEIVRSLVSRMLERAGYKVISAGDGADAVEKFMENKDTVSLVLSDVVMPKKTGREIYEEVKALRPDIRVIFISGYTADIIHNKGIQETDFDFITKPFSKNALLSKIREVLDRE